MLPIVSHLRIADSNGARESVALAVWLTKFLNEFGVPAVYFTPALDDLWDETMRNVIKFATSTSQHDKQNCSTGGVLWFMFASSTTYACRASCARPRLPIDDPWVQTGLAWTREQDGWCRIWDVMKEIDWMRDFTQGMLQP